MPITQGFVLNRIPKPEHRKKCFNVHQMESLSLVNWLSRFKEHLQYLQTARTCSSSFIRFLVFLQIQPLAFLLIASFSMLRGYIRKHLERLSRPFYTKAKTLKTSPNSRAQPAYFAEPLTFLFGRLILTDIIVVTKN